MFIERELRTCFDLCVAVYPEYTRPDNMVISPLEHGAVVEGEDSIEYICGADPVEDTFYFCYQGSNGREDWLDNADFHQVPFVLGRVHHGFLEQHEKSIDRVKQLAQGYHRVIVTGHSLGAALATLAAIVLKMESPNRRVGCVPLASPRVGDKEFVQKFNERLPFTPRYVYGKDLVTYVPLCLGGYAHVGKKVHLGPTRICKRVSDHDPRKYRDAFYQMAPRAALDT